MKRIYVIVTPPLSQEECVAGTAGWIEPNEQTPVLESAQFLRANLGARPVNREQDHWTSQGIAAQLDLNAGEQSVPRNNGKSCP